MPDDTGQFPARFKNRKQWVGRVTVCEEQFKDNGGGPGTDGISMTDTLVKPQCQFRRRNTGEWNMKYSSSMLRLFHVVPKLYYGVLMLYYMVYRLYDGATFNSEDSSE